MKEEDTQKRHPATQPHYRTTAIFIRRDPNQTSGFVALWNLVRYLKHSLAIYIYV